PEWKHGARPQQPLEPCSYAFWRSPQLLVGAPADVAAPTAVAHDDRGQYILAAHRLVEFEPSAPIADDRRVRGAKVNTKIHAKPASRGFCLHGRRHPGQ